MIAERMLTIMNNLLLVMQEGGLLNDNGVKIISSIINNT